jgi:hypothetical protein
MENIRLPFRIGGLYGGMARLDGLVILSAESLTLEYRMSDTLVGTITGGIKSRSIPWSELDRAECGLGFFTPWLSLASRALSTFDGLPSPDPCQLRVRVPWKHRRQLRALTSEINLQLSYREADRYRRQIAEREVNSILKSELES